MVVAFTEYHDASERNNQYSGAGPGGATHPSSLMPSARLEAGLIVTIGLGLGLVIAAAALFQIDQPLRAV